MLYTLRAECARDLEGTLRAVREIGYEGRADRPARPRPARGAGLLDELGLAVCGRHASLERSRPTWTGSPASCGRSEPTASCWRGSLPATARRRTPWWPDCRARRSGCATPAPARLPQPRRRAAPARRRPHRPRQAARARRGRALLRGRSRLGVVCGRGACGLVERLAPRVPLVHVKDLAPRAERASFPSATERWLPPGAARARRARHRVAPRRAGRGREPGSTRCADRSRLSRTWSGVRHEGPARVGIVGCGVISSAYAANAAAFDTFEIVACATSRRTVGARRRARARSAVGRGAARVPFDRPRPQPHASARPRGRDAGALEAGKHVYSEKPLARHCSRRRRARAFAGAGKRIGCAPTSSSAARIRRREPARRRCDRRAARRVRGDGRRRPGALASRSGHVLPERCRAAAGHGAVLPDGDRGAARPGAARDRVRLDARHRAQDRDRAPHGRAVRRGDADPHSSRARARRRPAGNAGGDVRGAGQLLRCCSCTAAKASSPCPTRTRSRAGADPALTAVAGRTFRMYARALATRAGSASTTSSKRSPRPPRASAELAAHVVDVAVDPRLRRARFGGGDRVEARRPSAAARRGRAAPSEQPSCDDDERRVGARGRCWRSTDDGVDYRDLNGNGVLDRVRGPGLPVEERVDDLIAQMTLEEEALLFHQGLVVPDDGRGRRRARRDLAGRDHGASSAIWG